MKQLKTFIQWFIVFFLVIAALPAFCAQDSQSLNHGMGILNIRSQSVGQSLRLTLPLVAPGDIKPGLETYARGTWTNSWAQEKTYLLDYEMLDSNLGFNYGFNRQWGIGVMFDSRSYFGGGMDGFIQKFHDLVGIGQNGRGDHPKGRAIINGYDPSTGDLISQNSASDFNNSGLNLLINYNLIHYNRILPAINFYCVARYSLEAANIVTKEHGIDLGFGLGFAKKWCKDFYTYAIAGYTLYDDQGKPEQNSLELKDHQFTGLFAMAYTLSQDFAILAQYLYSTSVVETIQGLDEPSHEVHLGMKFRMGENTTMGISIIENIITMDNSPDFGIHLGLSFKL